MNKELSMKEQIIQRNKEVQEEPERERKKLIPLSIIPSSLDRILKEQDLLGKENKKEGDLSPKAKRSKRYYIRKRINSGKPYIPREIRALGKEKARELGYDDWERRNLKSEEEEKDERLETLNKLRVIARLIAKTRMRIYLRRLNK